MVEAPQPGSWAYQPGSSAWRFTQEAGAVDWADPGNEHARVAWERAQAIMDAAGEPGWKSAQADQGQLLRQIATDLYHAADDQAKQVAEDAQRPITADDSPQRAFEQYQHAMDTYHAVEDRVERVTQRWKKLLDQEKSGRMFRPVVEAPQPGASSSSGSWGTGAFPGLPGGGGLTDG
ncbi:hypothetical protein ACFWFF_40625, partial [Streptomyces sp. NPDC060223]